MIRFKKLREYFGINEGAFFITEAYGENYMIPKFVVDVWKDFCSSEEHFNIHTEKGKQKFMEKSGLTEKEFQICMNVGFANLNNYFYSKWKNIK